MSAVESVLTEPRFKFETPAVQTTYQLVSVLADRKDSQQERIIHFFQYIGRKAEDLFHHHTQIQ